MNQSVFPVLISTGDQVCESAAYYYDNEGRGERAHIAIQRTLSGRGWYRDKRGEREVRPGQAFIFTHDEQSAYGFPANETEPYHLRFVTARAGILAPVFDQIRADFGSVLSMPNGSEAGACFDELHERFTWRSFRDRLHEAELLHALLVALYREQVQGTRGSDPIEFSYHYLRSHFRSPINLKLVADKCGLSREHLSRRFAERYGEAPGGLLRRLRLEHAQTMLKTSGSDVESIALASGYTSANTFCRAFRQAFGHSPRNRKN